MSTKTRAIVTGGAGFIGSHVATALLEAGHDVLVIDDLSRGARENVPAGARLEVVDIIAPAVDEVVAAFRPEAVFHHAAQMDVRHSVADPTFDATVNVAGTVRVAASAARSGCKLFALASTGGAIYGEQERYPADESHPTRRVTVRGEQALRRGLPRLLPARAPDARRRAALRQRLRPAPGPAR